MLKVALNRAVEAFTQERRRLHLSAYRVCCNLSTEASEGKASVPEGTSHICNDDGVEHRVPRVHDGAALDVPWKDPGHTHRRPCRRAQRCVSRHHSAVDCADALCYLCTRVEITPFHQPINEFLTWV